MSTPQEQAAALQHDWDTNSRWNGIIRSYTADEVVRLRGSLLIEHTLAQKGAAKLWKLLEEEPFIRSLGAITGGMAMQQVKAGLKAIYLSGWQVAADGNTAHSMYPDQSLYPVDSVPKMIERINHSFQRADQIQWSKGVYPGNDKFIDYFAPIIADAEAGFSALLS